VIGREKLWTEDIRCDGVILGGIHRAQECLGSRGSRRVPEVHGRPEGFLEGGHPSWGRRGGPRGCSAL